MPGSARQQVWGRGGAFRASDAVDTHVKNEGEGKKIKIAERLASMHSTYVCMRVRAYMYVRMLLVLVRVVCISVTRVWDGGVRSTTYLGAPYWP